MTPALKGGHSLMHHVGDHADWKFPDTRNSPVDEGEIGVLARNRVTLNDLNILGSIITCVFKHPPLVDQTGDTAVLAHKVEAGQNLFRLVILRQLLEYLRAGAPCPHACRGRTSPREPKDKGLPDP